MTRGTRVFLLAAGIVVATLIGYYGFYMAPAADPDEAATAGHAAGDAQLAMQDPVAADTEVAPAVLPKPEPIIVAPPREVVEEDRRPSRAGPGDASTSGRSTSAANENPAPGAGSSSTPQPVAQPKPEPAAVPAGERPVPPGRTPPAADQPRPNTPAQLSTPATTWTVRAGDSLYRIAEQALGDGTAWRRIVDANRGINPDALRIGQVLTIPPRRSRAAPVSDPIPAGTHEVVSGETLSDIAKQYYGNATRWREIYAANRSIIGNRPGDLAVGMRLRIPGA